MQSRAEDAEESEEERGPCLGIGKGREGERRYGKEENQLEEK